MGGDVWRQCPQNVVLSSYAVAILERIPRERGNPYVFPGRAGAHSRQWLSTAWQKLRNGIPELEETVPKDLRSTVASWLVQMGYPESFAAEILRHGKTTVTGRYYAHQAAGPIRRAMERYGRAIMEAAGKEDPGAKVIALRPDES